MIITIDGPAGAGKSVAARALAKKLGFDFLDTGAMYRTVALAGLRRGVDWNKPEQLADAAKAIDLRMEKDRVFLDGEDVSEKIRTPEVTAITRYAADNAEVRRHLIEKQRQIAVGKNIVTEGRDQGTLAFPFADCKFFLTATPEERARRRCKELISKGQAVEFEQVLVAQNKRDAEDATREYGALLPAADATEIISDGLDFVQVVEKLAVMAIEKLDRQGKLIAFGNKK